MTTNWVLLPVPEQDSGEFRDIIATRQRDRNEPLSPETDEIRNREMAIAAVKRAAFERQPRWSGSGYAQLAEGSSKTTARLSEVMQLCADHPETFFSTEDIAEQTSLSIEAWRNACRNIKKRLVAEFPDAPLWESGPYAGQPAWPLTAVSGRDLHVRDQLYVGLAADQAALWNEQR